MSEDGGQEAVGRVLAGQYRIDAVLGHGAMGSVYRGLQLSVNRPVAIKLITGALASNPECIKRFRREAEAMARLHHPNSVRLFDFGVDGGELYMVMELLEGEDLSQRIERTGAVSPVEALDLVRQILLALSEAHAIGIVHRDLKPANVFLSRVHDGQVFAKVMDFGIASIEQAAGTKLTLSGTVLGTPAYMSPEQAQGRATDARSDLYSLGMMLFEMLTGRVAFEADSIVSLLLAQVNTPPPRLAELSPRLAHERELQALLDALLAKDPEQRLASASAAIERVEAMARRLARPTTPVLAYAPTAVASAPVQRELVSHGAVPLASTARLDKAKSATPKQLALGAALLALLAVGLLFARSRSNTTELAPATSAAAATQTRGAQPALEPASVGAAVAPAASAADAPGSERPHVAGTITAPSKPSVERSQTSESSTTPFPRVRSAVAKLEQLLDGSRASEPPARRSHTYDDVASAKRAYKARDIDAQTYKSVIRALKERRARRITAEKKSYRAGAISRAEYERRVHRIDAEYEGR